MGNSGSTSNMRNGSMGNSGSTSNSRPANNTSTSRTP
jgi:hypothetical protein